MKHKNKEIEQYHVWEQHWSNIVNADRPVVLIFGDYTVVNVAVDMEDMRGAYWAEFKRRYYKTRSNIKERNGTESYRDQKIINEIFKNKDIKRAVGYMDICSCGVLPGNKEKILIFVTSPIEWEINIENLKNLISSPIENLFSVDATTGKNSPIPQKNI